MVMAASYPNLKINISDIEKFALFSHDQNPLHTDDTFARKTFFGQRIAHGALAVLKILVNQFEDISQEIQALDVEFRRPVFPDIEYTVSGQKSNDNLKLTVTDNTTETLIITLKFVVKDQDLDSFSDGVDTSWVEKTSLNKSGVPNIHPFNRQIEDFKLGDIFWGSYSPDFSQLNSEWYSVLPSGTLALLGLASFVVGMESPGLRSLFTKLSLKFNTGCKFFEEAVYKIETKRIDPKFRMLQNELTVCNTNGTVLAVGALRSYVRFTPIEANYGNLQKLVKNSCPVLTDKIALVCGGSRGLGADIAVSLAFSGCKVFATYRNSQDAVNALIKELEKFSLDIEFVKADAGDEAWCEKMCRTIDSQYGGLDILVLNAATPPKVFEFCKNDVTEFDAYISTNIRLVQRPLNGFITSVNQKHGIISAISSSFVVETPKEFPQYVALKQAVEGMIQAVSKEYSDIQYFLPRPPKLQTNWNDTPTGAWGALPTDQVAVRIVSEMGKQQDDRVSIVSNFDHLNWKKEYKREVVLPPADFHAVISANFTADLIDPGFGFWFKELRVNGEVVFSPYNQILQELINPNSQISSNKDGVSVILLKLNDWLRELDESKIQSETSVREFLAKSVQESVRAMKTHRGHCKVETTLVICPNNDCDEGPSWVELLDQTEDQLLFSLEGLPGLTILKAVEFHDIYQIKEDQIHDPLREKIGHIPYQKSYFHFLSTLVIRNVYRKMVPICKVVVVDCDNTLWKGVVGEVGAKGVTFEKSHAALQEKLMALSLGGVVVSLCSKNEGFDVWSVFDNRPDFKLSRENIVSAMINWQPKSENIKKLATQLNLGLANFVFIDDNPVECAEVQAACPQVLTIQWPQDPEEAYTLLNHIWELDITKGTAVDQKRTQMYKEELKRQEFMEDKVDFGEFLKSLELKTDLRDLNDGDLPRASQLTMRTNQFNFTTRRRKEGELKALMSDDSFIMQTVRVSDRFGDYGLVGFYIGEIRGGQLVVDTFLLSCRVLGRGVEHYMLNELGRFADRHGIETVRLEIFPTPRNTPARDFLESVSPEECCKTDQDDGICSIIPSKELIELELVPSSEQKSDEEETKAKKNKKEHIKNTDTPMLREAQIKRAAYELSDMARLSALIEGKEQPQNVKTTNNLTNQDKPSLAALVYEVFSQELDTPVEILKQGDVLEDLGCDSFKIVEITVRLVEKFPKLPVTLLFEHRSISDIIDAIHNVGQNEPKLETKFDLNTGDRYAEGHDIAVIGIGLSCSGGQSKKQLWDLLANQETSIRKVSPDRRFFLEPFEGDQEHWGGLMEDLDGFDAEFFGISPREASLTDPQTRLALETSWKAIEDAGYTGDQLIEDTGVYIGAMYSDYSFRANQVANEEKSPYRSWETFSIANRLSHFMGFRGPSFTIETACSSSGTAIHLACRALRGGECRMAVAGGVNLILDPNRFGQLKRLGILSPTGNCQPFCDDSNGVLMGEGTGVIVMKPLVKAVQDKDHIYGIIKGSALSSGTGGVGFTAPNPKAQALAISKCIQDAGIDPRTVSYIETHGTGTSLGDPIEVRGLSLAYENKALWDSELEGEHACSIGSIKPNIGHLESGAGVLSLIKVLLQFEKKSLLPSTTSGKLNSKIPFSETPFDVQRSLSEWKRPVFAINGQDQEIPRRAGVSSFGVGGANAHIILEEPGNIPQQETGEQLLQDSDSVYVLPLSADSQPSLMKIARETAEFCKTAQGINIVNICATAALKRRHFSNRAAFITTDIKQLSEKLQRFADGETPVGCFCHKFNSAKEKGKTAFLFTGQGAQYINMGRELYQASSVFKEAVDACAAILDKWMDYPLMEIIYPTKESSDLAARIDQTAYTQVSLFSIEYALSQLWLSWGIQPDFCTGHSAGEIIALAVSKALSLADGLKLIHARGKLMQALPPGGKMVAVRIDASSAERLIEPLQDQVSIASVNGPELVVLSGTGEAVDRIVQDLEKNDITFKHLNVSHAFHSHLMDPMLSEYLEVVSEITLKQPQYPVVSCVTGQVIDINDLGPDYWRDQVRQAVRFRDAMSTLDANGVSVFIEIGPHPVLLGMGSLCLSNDDAVWMPSLRKGKPNWQTIYESLSRLYTLGIDFNWSGIYNPAYVKKADLPSYQFHHGRYWLKKKFKSQTVQTERKKDLSNCLYAVDWIEESFEKTSALSDLPQTWILFSEEEEVSHGLVSWLEQAGHTVTQIFRDNRYDQNANEYQKMLHEVLADHNSVDGIAFLWGMDGCKTSDLDVSDILTYQAQVLNSFLILVQTVNALSTSNKPKVWGITRRTSIPVLQSMIWGFGRGVSLESPDIWGGLIELYDEFDINSGVNNLGGILENFDKEDQIRLGYNRRWVPRLVAKPISSETKLRFKTDGVYLVTGGFGALGKRLISWLVSRGVKQIIVTSRKGMKSAEAAPFVDSLKSSETQIDVVSIDISQKDDVAGFFRQLSLDRVELKGIFHLAGIDQPESINTLGMDKIQAVLTPKVQGTWLLHQYSQDFAIDIFVCFSSIASVLGSENRAHYSAANAFIDSIIKYRRENNLPAISVNWGPWDKGGMATSQDVSSYAKIGNYALDPDAAIKVFELLIETDTNGLVVADLDWTIFSKIYEARRSRPLISLLRSETTLPDHSNESNTLLPWVKIISELDAQSKKGRLISLLSDEISRLLGYEDSSELSIENDFTTIGVDSLVAAELSVSIQKNLGLKGLIIIHDHPNMTALADKLLGDLSDTAPIKNLSETDKSEEPIVGYSDALEGQILEFFHKAWPHRTQDLIEPRWQWMYLESAKRLETAPIMWNYMEADNVIGYTGGIPVQAKLMGNNVTTAWCVDTMVLKSCRDKGIGPIIMMKAKEDLPFSLSLGQTNEMRSILFSLGWQQVAPLQVYVFPLRPGKMLKGKMNPLLAKTAGAGLQLLAYTKNQKTRSKLLDLDVNEIDQFSERHDELWEEVKSDYKCAVVRDASYLNWKYIDQPGQTFRRFEMKQGSKVVGTAVLMFRDTGPHTPYKYRRAFIVDLVTAISDLKMVLSLLEAIRIEVIKLDYDSITFEIINKDIEKALKQFGFLKRDPGRYFLIYSSDTDENEKKNILDADNWFVTKGDSDIDRPEGGIQ
jgi:FkbH-like protein